ncbi:MAG: ATP-binding protein [Candidatus Omnitrophota bacterium]
MSFIQAITNFIVSVLIFFLGLFVYLKGKKHRNNKMFFIFSVPVSVWLYFYGLAFLSKDIKAIEVFFRCGYIFIVFIPILTFHFCLVFLQKDQKSLRYLLYAGYLLAGIFIFSILFTNYIISGLFQYRWGHYPKASLPGHILFLLYFNAYYILATLLLFFGFWKIKNISPIEKAKRKYVFLAWMIGSFAAFDFIPNYGFYWKIHFFPMGSVFMVFTYALIGYAVVKYRLMDIRVFFSRAVAFLISYLFLLGVPFFFAYRMYPILYPFLGMHWWLVPIGLLVFFGTVAPLAYEQIRVKMEETFLAEQKRYQKLLLQASSGMVREHNLHRLSKLFVYLVKRIVKIEFAAIFLEDKERNVYYLKEMRNSGSAPRDIVFSYGHQFVEYLKQKKEPVLYEELPSAVKQSFVFPLPVSLIIPSFIENNLLGFVILGEKFNREPYLEGDMDVFKILAHQAAMAIENCLFFEEFKSVQQKIFTAEKLASIGGMADGVAHQIKNRLNHFSVASGEMQYEIKDFIEKNPQVVDQSPELKKSLDYLSEIARSLVENVKRTDGVVKGILNYARVEEKETFFSYFSLQEVLTLSLELLRIKHEIVQFPLEADIASCDTLYGVKAQIMESVYNILDNGYEAVQEKRRALSEEEKITFQPRITFKATQNEHCYHIETSDNGIGIKEEDKHKIFAPFFTTKSSYKSGTGIGMYVVKRIVEENHKGKITFDSTYTQGTRFVIDLPKK